jgi:NAD(P)-dependent dehydrogenase (short-subunit alcohol dehydrogenase family)
MALSARRTLVTGASQPLGIALVRYSLQRGDKVYAAARNPARVPVLADLRAEYSGLELIALDPADAASVADAIPVLEGLTSSLDLLVLGPAEPGAHDRLSDAVRDDVLESLSGTGITEHFRRHAVAPLLLVRTLLPLLTASESARVLAVASWRGAVAAKDGGGGYATDTSAAALHMMMRALSFDLQPLAIPVCMAGAGQYATVPPDDEDDVTLGDVAQGLLHVLERMPREKSGAFYDWTGTERSW